MSRQTCWDPRNQVLSRKWSRWPGLQAFTRPAGGLWATHWPRGSGRAFPTILACESMELLAHLRASLFQNMNSVAARKVVETSAVLSSSPWLQNNESVLERESSICSRQHLSPHRIKMGRFFLLNSQTLIMKTSQQWFCWPLVLPIPTRLP